MWKDVSAFQLCVLCNDIIIGPGIVCNDLIWLIEIYCNIFHMTFLWVPKFTPFDLELKSYLLFKNFNFDHNFLVLTA